MTVVVPPQAAERVPLSKLSAMRAGASIGWSRWQCASTPPGCDDAAGGIDLAGAAFQAGAQLGDPAAADTDVAVEGVAGSGDTGVADDQIKGHGHTFAALLWC